MQSSRCFFRLYGLSCALLAGAVQAQDAAPTDTASVGGTLQEIIVTARKQGETALDAPATVTILTADALESANITQLNQLNGLVPGLVQTPGVGGLPATNFRGLGSNTSNFGIEASVALFQDGVYLAHTRDYVSPTYDVDHIELIKGTQATLLGKNTSLGAISIVNRKPGNDFGFDLATTYSRELEGTRATGGVDLPMTEALRARVAFLASDEEGYYRNALLGRDEQQLRDLSGRLSLAWDVTDGSDVLFVYQHDDRDAEGQNLELLTDPAGVVRARATAAGQTDFDSLPNHRSFSGSAAFGAGQAGVVPFDEQSTDRLNLLANVDLGGFTLTSQSAYIDWSSQRSSDLDFTAAALLDLADEEKNREFTQEVRIASPSHERFNFLAGLFYYENDWNLIRRLTGNTLPLTGGYVNDLRIETEAVSVFTSANWEIIDRLTLSAGARFTNETKEATYTRSGTGTIGAVAFPAIPTTTLPELESDEYDGNVGLQFEVTPNLMTYASWSRGSKSGGFLDTPVTVAGARYEGETAYTIEAGVKLDAGSLGFATLALFDTKIDDYQTNYVAIVGGVAQGVIGNSTVRTRGVEVSGSFAAADWLKLSGSWVYAPAEFTEDFPNSTTPIATDGMLLPRAPRNSGKIQADFDLPITAGLKLTSSLGLSYTSRAYLQFIASQPLAPVSRSRELLDASIGVGSISDSWKLSLIGTNLTDEDFVEFATQVSAGGGAYYGSVGRPRVIALQLSLSY